MATRDAQKCDNMDQVRLEIDRIVKQRNTLLKQAGGRLTPEIETTLDVWDAKFSDVAERFGGDDDRDAGHLAAVDPRPRDGAEFLDDHGCELKRLVVRSHDHVIARVQQQTGQFIPTGVEDGLLTPCRCNQHHGGFLL